MNHQLVEITTHEFTSKETGSGCKLCGFGPGALEHNTTQPTWKALRSPNPPSPAPPQ